MLRGFGRWLLCDGDLNEGAAACGRRHADGRTVDNDVVVGGNRRRYSMALSNQFFVQLQSIVRCRGGVVEVWFEPVWWPERVALLLDV